LVTISHYKKKQTKKKNKQKTGEMSDF